MITIKAFDKNLRCLGFQYKVGEEYEIPADKVKICERGFHASAHCDISETIVSYPNIINNRYCLVDIHVVDKKRNKVVGDKIKILKELSFKECIEYDRTGRWCYEYAKITGDKSKIKILENAVIKKDKTGVYCYKFARDIKGADIQRLQDAVIEKDKTGLWWYYFVEFVNNVYGLGILQKMKDSLGKDNNWYKYLKKSLEKNTL